MRGVSPFSLCVSGLIVVGFHVSDEKPSFGYLVFVAKLAWAVGHLDSVPARWLGVQDEVV